jgi:uncharacterized membrane protein
MFNDEIMGMYLVLTIYLLGTQNKPMLAALALTAGLSMKAGVMLMLPAFLGAVQYAFGTYKLIGCLLVIVGFQILVALPFTLFGETTVSEYLMRSRFAGGGRNGIG